MASEDFTLGVGEEYQIINPHTRRLQPRTLNEMAHGIQESSASD